MSFNYDRPDIYLALAAFVLATGIYGLVRRRTLIGMLIAGELILTPPALISMVEPAQENVILDMAVNLISGAFNSMLASRDSECALSVVEPLTLGPFARRR